MPISSLDPNYADAVEDICRELLKLGLPTPIVEAISKATAEQSSGEYVDTAKVRFPGALDVVQKFSIEELWNTVQRLMSTEGIAGGETAAIQLQLSALLDLRRHYGRRKLPRMQKIVRAAHRRAIVTGSDGAVKHDLLRRITRLLAN